MKSPDRKPYILFGVMATLIYFSLLLTASYPFDDFLIFIKEAPFNERGDFLSGVFGPVAFLWLVVGYFMQAHELKVQREAFYAQSQLILYELELQKRAADPAFRIGEIESRIMFLENIGKEAAKKVYIYHVSHQFKKMQIIAIANYLFGDDILSFSLAPPLVFPDMNGKNAELLIVFDSQLDLIRGQRFGLVETDKGVIGWEFGPSGDLPEYFHQYT